MSTFAAVMVFKMPKITQDIGKNGISFGQAFRHILNRLCKAPLFYSNRRKVFSFCIKIFDLVVNMLLYWEQHVRTCPSFLKKEVCFDREPPKLIILNNRRPITANKIQKLMKINNFRWKTVLEYIAISNGRSKRIVGSINTSIAKVIFKKQQGWTTSIRPVL